jgi:hypothetical protein
MGDLRSRDGRPTVEATQVTDGCASRRRGTARLEDGEDALGAPLPEPGLAALLAATLQALLKPLFETLLEALFETLLEALVDQAAKPLAAVLTRRCRHHRLPEVVDLSPELFG